MKNDIVKYLKKNIASYKWPKIVDFAKELPKTISGKVRRAEIKKNDWVAGQEDVPTVVTEEQPDELESSSGETDET